MKLESHIAGVFGPHHVKFKNDKLVREVGINMQKKSEKPKRQSKGNSTAGRKVCFQVKKAFQRSFYLKGRIFFVSFSPLFSQLSYNSLNKILLVFG